MTKLKDLMRKTLSLSEDQVFKEDIFYLLEKTFSLSREELFIKDDLLIEESEFNKRVQEYLDGKPLYYIIGKAPFYRRDFIVKEGVTLIPRNETEELVYYVINRVSTSPNLSILDIGTGTGCIALTLDKELNNPLVDAIDISLETLEVAKENNKELNGKVNFFLGDCFAPINDKKYDIIVSNPPYIKRGNFVGESVLKYEPELALFAEEDGLVIYHKIIKDIDKHLNDNGFAIFEISPDLEEGLTKLIKEYIPSYSYEFIKDINNFVRFLVLNK